MLTIDMYNDHTSRKTGSGTHAEPSCTDPRTTEIPRSMPITQMLRKSRSEYVVVRQLNKLGVRCRSSRLRNCGAGLSPLSPSSAGNWLNDDKKAMKYSAATPRKITSRAMV